MVLHIWQHEQKHSMPYYSDSELFMKVDLGTLVLDKCVVIACVFGWSWYELGIAQLATSTKLSRIAWFFLKCCFGCMRCICLLPVFF
jgi:hypothetical protein